MAAIHLGTSGYVYKHWKGLLYPTGLPASRWLPRYARAFTTVELNATFYRLPTAQAVDGWRDAVPPGFRFACKGSRFLTHMKPTVKTQAVINRRLRSFANARWLRYA